MKCLSTGVAEACAQQPTKNRQCYPAVWKVLWRNWNNVKDVEKKLSFQPPLITPAVIEKVLKTAAKYGIEIKLYLLMCERLCLEKGKYDGKQRAKRLWRTWHECRRSTIKSRQGHV